MGQSDLELSESVLKRLLSARSPDDICQTVLREIAYRLPADGCEFALESKTGIEVVATKGEVFDETAFSEITSPFSLTQLVYQHDQSIRINDITDTRGATLSGSPSVQAPSPADTIRAVLCVPVADVGVIIAVANSSGAFSEKDLEWLTQLADYASASFERFVNDSMSYESELQRIQTARKRMEYALDMTNSYIWAVDLQTEEVTRLIGPIERQFGSVSDEINDIQDMIGYFVHPAEHSDIERLYGRLQTGDLDEFEISHRTPAACQDIQWFRASGQVQVEAGERRLVGLSMDISDQKKREQELEIQNERLERLTSVISHDLRNPLSVATGRLELAFDDCESEHLADIQHALDRMQTLINDLLSLAREGEPVTEPERVILSEIAETCWRNVQTGAAKLDVDSEQGLLADRSRLQQLLENLFRNSVEHSGDDVRIFVGDLEDGFYVEDTGPGISPDDCEDVFKYGYSTTPGGTGFGLSIVEEIANAHGWDITIAEGRDGGARFEISRAKVVD